MTQALAFPMISAVGNIDAYIAAAKRFPILTEEEEFRWLRASGKKKASGSGAPTGSFPSAPGHFDRPRLSWLRIAPRRPDPGRQHRVDEGGQALRSVARRAARFIRHPLIKAEIHEYVLRNWRMVKLATTKAQRKLFFNLRSMKPGSETLTPDAGGRRGAPVKRQAGRSRRRAKTRLSGHDIALEAGSDDEEGFAPIAYLEDSRSEPTRVLERRDRDHLHSDGLQTALSGLDDRSRRIVEARWLSEDLATLHDLAAEFGVSAERIR